MDLSGSSPLQQSCSSQNAPLRAHTQAPGKRRTIALLRLLATLVTLSLLLAACASQPPNQPDPDPEPEPDTRPFGDLRLEQFATGFNSVVAITNAGDNRLFVVERAGTIRIVQNGQTLAQPFLDLRGQVATTGEQGLVGLAFPPNYASSGAFYVYYTGNNGRGRLARFRRDPANANRALSTPEELIVLSEASEYHNGGALAFGPDGYLYWAVGDAANPNLAQNLNSLRGKILRLDVSGSTGYTVPASNPFVSNTTALDEIWALGLRNPWRFSFDMEEGLIVIADVGQDAHEEVNMAPVESGGLNYGWPILEGNACYPSGDSCNRTGLTAPTFTYAHPASSGRSVTGGYVYRGPNAPDLVGSYVFGDFVSAQLLRTSASDGWQIHDLIESGPEPRTVRTATFGEGRTGRLFVSDWGTGTVYEITQRQP